MVYIKGGTYGKMESDGCTDNSEPIEVREYKISHKMYFAKNSKNWDNGGVAFISTSKQSGEEILGRVWKITNSQFNEVCSQEGSWYDEKVDLGTLDEIPIWTVTSLNKLETTKPSDSYLKTIIAGLKETYKKLNDNDICSYLIKKDGIKNNYDIKKLKELC